MNSNILSFIPVPRIAGLISRIFRTLAPFTQLDQTIYQLLPLRVSSN